MSRWYGSIVSADGPQANTLYPFTSFTFLPIVAAGSEVGPTLAQMQTAYAGQPWLSSYFSLGSFQGYQRWKSPATTTFTFELGGAMGGTGEGTNLSISTKAYGAKIVASIALTALDVIEIVVGGKGGSNGGAHGNENGGGGATWVKNITQNTLLFVAGGAGGTPSSSYGLSATRTIATGQGQSTQAGGISITDYTPATPTVGNGGTTAGSYSGGAGGGYNSVGANGSTHCAASYGGGYYGNGLVGGAGNSCYTTDNKGGFGGGGGGQLSGPGGGGGYTGGSCSGDWSSYSNYGGGGGSYTAPAATGVTVTAGGNTGSLGGYVGAGYCKITLG